MNKFRILLAAAALAVITSGAASAQTADAALAEAVSAAFAATQAQSSFHIATQTFVESNRGGDDAGVSSQSVSAFDAAAGAGGWNVAGTQTTTTAVANGTQDLTTELIVLDGVTSMRQADGEWMTLGGGAAEDTQAAPMPTSNQASRVLGALLLPVEASTVTAISALPADTIDGQSMNVYQITLDSQAMLDSDASALLSGGGGGMMRGGMPGGAAPDGAAMPEGQQPPDMQATPGAMPDGQQPPQGGGFGMRDLAAEDVQVTIAVYIGAEDGLIHRIYSVIDVASSGDDTGSFSQRTTAIMDLSAFGQPVTITAPDTSA